MTNDYRKGWAYRHATDKNFRARARYASRIRTARRELITDNPRAKCQSSSRSPHGGALELHHVAGDLTGRAGYRVLCRKHNREAAGQSADKKSRRRAA